MPGMRTLITGGVKSGKSTRALQTAQEMFGRPRVFVATAEAFDDEMRTRIDAHKRERGETFETVEEPLYIDEHVCNNLLLDCVTMWINNILYYEKEDDWERILTRFLDGLGENAVIVTNETGLGNIPPDPKTRAYNRMLGKANMMVASAVDRVVFMVSGQALVVK